MINKLHKLGVKVITIIDPYIKIEKDYAIYNEAKEFSIKNEKRKFMLLKVGLVLALFQTFLIKKPEIGGLKRLKNS